MTQVTDERSAIRWWLRVFTDLAARVGDAIEGLKDDVDVPIGIRRDLQEIEACLRRLLGWLRDEQQRAGE